jgi:hypothetical protein
MKKIFVILGVLAATLFCGSGCSYFMLWQVASYEHDETRADRELRALEEERALRMQADSNYTDQQINAVMERSSIGTHRSSNSRPLTVEELREQQERERRMRRR